MQTSDGLRLFTKNHLVENALASVLITHGLAEHCERYTHVAAALNEIGCNVYMYDLRGHGKSEGEKGFINQFDQYRQDLEIIYNAIPKNLPIFMLGHSMGGLITYNFLLFRERTHIKGVLFSGPALAVGKDITPITQKIVGFLAKFTPKLGTVKLDSKNLTRDEAERAKCDNDPLVYHKGTKAGLGNQLLKAIVAAETNFKDFIYPVLIMHGEADNLANPEGSKNLFSQCGSQDKTLKIWEGAKHEIFNEINREEVLKYTTSWIKSRI